MHRCVNTHPNRLIGCGRHGRLLGSLAVLVVAAATLVSPAQAANTLDELYGRGVHDYFRGNVTASIQTLSDCLAAGSQDPRVFFYRGLALASVGRTDEAVADFIKGSQIENDTVGSWDVSKSLERIQGPSRYWIEKHRLAARVVAAERKPASLRPDSRILPPATVPPPVLRESRPIPNTELPPTPPAKNDSPVPPENPSEDEDMTEGPAEREDMPASEPKEEMKKPAEDDPFGDDPFGK